MAKRIVKRCGCGRTFTKPEWQRLLVSQKNAGRVIIGGILCEFRNCDKCGSTLTYMAPELEKKLLRG